MSLTVTTLKYSYERCGNWIEFKQNEGGRISIAKREITYWD